MLTLDVGSSSARTLLFGFDGRQIESFRIAGPLPRPYHFPTEAGSRPRQAHHDRLKPPSAAICEQMRAKGIKPTAVAVDTRSGTALSASIRTGTVSLRLLHPFDTRSADAAGRGDSRAASTTTHSTHAPAGQIHPKLPTPARVALALRDATRCIPAHETLDERRRIPISEILRSATGCIHVDGVCHALAFGIKTRTTTIRRCSRPCPCRAGNFLTPPGWMNPSTATDSGPSYRVSPGSPRWATAPATTSAADARRGSGLRLWSARAATMRGPSSGADRIEIPDGLFCYRVDKKRFVLGGALSNGGEVFAWIEAQSAPSR